MKVTRVDFNIGDVNGWFTKKSPEQLLEWAVDKFQGEVVLACSFGAEDVVLVDMLSKVTKKPRIFYLDTDKHFKETYETRDKLADKYGIEFIRVRPRLTLEEQAKKYGDRLWERDPNQCCYIRKVEPLKETLEGEKAWITGIRREQSHTRAYTQLVEWDDKFELVKINPIAFWTTAQVWGYIKEHKVPYNPLHDQNYPSIGCNVCTKPVKPGEDARSGRWAGLMKTECGLHKGGLK